ncbi:MAG: PQQ-binding-like beta-propeller repeat protein, partial [Planctomycetota bacterium]
MRSLGLVAVLFAAGHVWGQSGTGRPRHNASFVPDDDEPTRLAVAAVRSALEQRSWTAAARGVDRLLTSRRPALVAVRGRELFVSPRRWAALLLLGDLAPAHPELLAAWRAQHDEEAGRKLRGAMAGGDEEAVERLLRRYPAATAAPAALLAVADRALLRRDLDRVRERLDRVPEHLPVSEAAAFYAGAPYRARAAHLATRRDPPPGGWPTLGGDATRARNGDPLAAPHRLHLLWHRAVLDEPPGYPSLFPENGRRQSLRLPFYPVADARRIYVHMGPAVRNFSRETGDLVAQVPPPEEGDPGLVDVVDRMLADSPGVRAVTLTGDAILFNRLLVFAEETNLRSHNELVAYDVRRHRLLWRSDPGTFFRGCPAVAYGRIYVYGARREQGEEGPTRKESAFLFCYRQEDGRLLWRRFLCYGDTDAPAQFPPLSGLAPAVSRGVAVVVTGLGAAAALDARTGEVLWLYRYDRLEPLPRERLQDTPERYIPHRSQWSREPPRIAGDRVVFAPFDSELLYACRLRGGRDPDLPESGFAVVLWEKHRTRFHQNSVLEYIAGVHADRVLCVGRRDRHQSAYSYETVVSPVLSGPSAGGLFAYARIPVQRTDPRTGAHLPPELYGRPTLAGSVLLVPTRDTLFRFDAAAVTPRMEAGEIRREIGEWMSVSIGIAPNRFLAKLAANLHKPDGLDEINATNLRAVLATMKLTDLFGIKQRNEARLS